MASTSSSTMFHQKDPWTISKPAAAAGSLLDLPSEDAAVENKDVVSVTDPQTIGEGSSKHTLYLISIRPSSSIRRRYSDFQWLYKRLVYEKPGAIIPLIPHRSAALQPSKRFSDDVIQERRYYLDVFLKKVMASGELRDSPSFVAFMKDDYIMSDADAAAAATGGVKGEEWLTGGGSADSPTNANAAAAAAAAAAASPTFDRTSSMSSNDGTNQPPPERKKVGFRVRNLLRRTAVAVGVATGEKELQTTDDENIFIDIERYVSVLDTQVKSLSKNVSMLVKAQRERGRLLDGIGDNFSNLGDLHNGVLPLPQQQQTNKSSTAAAGGGGSSGEAANGEEKKVDDDNGATTTKVTASEAPPPPTSSLRSSSGSLTGGPGSQYNKMGDGISAVASLWLQGADADVEKFDTPLQDLARDVQAAKLAVQRRKEIQLSYTTLLQRVEQKRASVARQFQPVNPDPEQEQKVLAAESKLQLAEEEATNAKEQFDVVTGRVIREVTRFKGYFQERLRKIVLDLSHVEITWNRKYEVGWSNLVPFLTTTTTGVSDGGGGGGVTSVLMQGSDGMTAGVANNLPMSSSTSMPSAPPPPAPVEEGGGGHNGGTMMSGSGAGGGSGSTFDPPPSAPPPPPPTTTVSNDEEDEESFL